MSEEIKQLGVRIGGPAGAVLVATADMADEIERLRAECLRLNHAEAEAMSVVLSQEGQIERLRTERNVLLKQRKADIDLSISYLAQVYGLIEEGEPEKASDFCRAAAETWTQDIAELEAALRGGEKQ